MKAPAVDYVRPRSLAEAVGLLAQHHGEARVIAGGQSLVAMMNLRVAAPGLLIDISRLPELHSVSEDTDAVSIGACVTHAAIGRESHRPVAGADAESCRGPRLSRDPHARHDRRQLGAV
jgi:carbon-monoxide dehydrogenase medium subunit